MRVSRDELCVSVTTPDVSGNVSGCIPLNPVKAASNFPWLGGLASSWERVVWHSLQISWRPAVGTTTDGIMCYGVDWEPKPGSYSVSRSAVTSLSPVKDHPVWQATDTQPWRGPTGMLQSRRHYLLTATDLDDACPGSLLYSVKGAPKTKDNFLGELWIRYDLTFIGPRQAPA